MMPNDIPRGTPAQNRDSADSQTTTESKPENAPLAKRPTSQLPASKPRGFHRVGLWFRKQRLPVAVVIALLVGLLIGGLSMSDAQPKNEPSADAHDSHDEATTWTCSMHPQIQLPEPGPCPICGMDLIPLDTSGGADRLEPNQVALSERAKTLARIQTAAVRRADTAVELRLLGRLEVDETKVRTITPWVDGRIDRLFVSTVGERIKRGQAIASIYSPVIYAAQADLIQARLQMEKLADALPIARRAAKAAYRSARTRLRLLGVSSGKARSMGKGRSARRNVTITSSYGGTVNEQLVHEGAYVKAGTPIYKTADLSTVWAQLDAYEQDLARISVGQPVELQISTYPDEIFKGTVQFIDPMVDPRTRTAQVRVEVPNKNGRLRPGMFADAVIQAPESAEVKPPLVIPNTAPLLTGKRAIVYVEVPGKERPTYESREVQLGPRASDVYPVISGINEGELVVINGAFVLDSDLQIRGGESMMSRGDDRDRLDHSPVRVSAKFLAGFGTIIEPYLEIHRALSKDEPEAAKRAFGQLADQTLAFDPRSPEHARALWHSIRKQLVAAARGGAHGDDIDELRRSYDSVSLALIKGLQRYGNPVGEPLRLAFCPMAFDNRGALWLQRSNEIENPYFGAKMYRCGEIRQIARPEQHLDYHAAELATPTTSSSATAAGHNH